MLSKFSVLVVHIHYLFHDEGPYHIETSSLLCKSMDWFLHDRDLRHERVEPSGDVNLGIELITVSYIRLTFEAKFGNDVATIPCVFFCFES